MCKYDIQNMYDGSEYFQNILLKHSKNILLLYFYHGMLWKIYNPWPKEKKC